MMITHHYFISVNVQVNLSAIRLSPFSGNSWSQVRTQWATIMADLHGSLWELALGGWRRDRTWWHQTWFSHYESFSRKLRVMMSQQIGVGKHARCVNRDAWGDAASDSSLNVLIRLLSCLLRSPPVADGRTKQKLLLAALLLLLLKACCCSQ